MKKLIICLFMSVLFYSSQAAAMHMLYAQAIAPAASTETLQSAGFESSPEWGKLGDTLQAAWQAAKVSGDMSQKLECFVRVVAPFDQGDASFLQSNGFNVSTSGGNVVRGHVTAANLQSVAKLPFVKKINLATK